VLETSDHPHNLFLKIAVERGVPAAVLFIVLLLSIFISIGRFRVPGSRLRTQIVPQPVTQNPQQFLLIAVLGVLAHNLIDYNLQFVGIALPFWMMLGILSGSAHCRLPAMPLPVTDGHIADPNTLNKKIVQLFELCIAVILLFIAFYEGLFLLTSSMGRHAEVRDDTVIALRWYDRSTGEFFSRDMHYLRRCAAKRIVLRRLSPSILR
jgi:hypothetical protein